MVLGACGVNVRPILQTWGRVLTGRVPSLAVEITRECPLRCPGCYAYEDAHLESGSLRSISDFKGDELIRRMLALVNEHKPLHLSIVGGDPLVRYRELEVLLPKLATGDMHIQVVTSAFREIPKAWAKLPRVQITVSIDGLQPEHDLRRKPATYERILKNIAGQHITVHCTITSAMTKRSGYLRDFVEFWSSNSSVEKIWMSMFTPQRGADDIECLTRQERRTAVEVLMRLRDDHPKLDMHESALRQFLAPPESPDRCIFAKTTRSISADFETVVEPCQFGGDPDCSRCGCFASMALAAVGNHQVLGTVRAGDIFFASEKLGQHLQRIVHGQQRRSDKKKKSQFSQADEKLRIVS